MVRTITKEIRAIKTEFRIQEKEGEPTKIVGYAAKFNQNSEEMWGTIERIKPGAFSEAILRSDVRALWNHDSNHVLGRTKSNTLTLKEDEVGLFYEITPPDTQTAKDLIESIKRGDVDQSSFAFTVDVVEWDTSEQTRIRTIIKVKELYDVSPVTYPAYPTATVGVRSFEEIAKEEFEKRSGEVPEAPEVPEANPDNTNSNAKAEEEIKSLEIYKDKIKLMGV